MPLLGIVVAQLCCAMTVTPSWSPDVVDVAAPDDGVVIDEMPPEDVATPVNDDGTVLQCPPVFRACDPDATTSCGPSPCSRCLAIAGFRPATPTAQRPGAICGRPNEVLECNTSLAFATCFEGGRGCYARPSNPTTRLPGPGYCYRIEECVELDRLSRATARPGDVISRCQWGDQTYARTGVAPPARCVSSPLPTCGTGCASCPGDRPMCMFQSEVYPTGICVPRNFGGPPNYRNVPDIPGTRCRVSPREVCRRGHACLLPVRNNVDFPDENRLGGCFDADVCQRFAAMFPDGYRCDATLADP